MTLDILRIMNLDDEFHLSIVITRLLTERLIAHESRVVKHLHIEVKTIIFTPL